MGVEIIRIKAVLSSTGLELELSLAICLIVLRKDLYRALQNCPRDILQLNNVVSSRHMGDLTSHNINIAILNRCHFLSCKHSHFLLESKQKFCLYIVNIQNFGA